MPGLNSLHPAVGEMGQGKLIGRTNGGMNPKRHAVTDDLGPPIRYVVTAGHVRDDADASEQPATG